MPHRAGFVCIIGHPNAGKSTLLNEILGEKLSIVTPKAQTTRHRILGILNGDDFQIVFSDTPGILEPRYKLQEAMVKSINSSIFDADHILLMVDLSGNKAFDEGLMIKLKSMGNHVTVLLNKLDLSNPEEAGKASETWKDMLPSASVFIISALHRHGVKELSRHIVSYLPESPPYFPKDQITDRSERFIVSEMVRKSILENTDREVPYSVQVVINNFKEEEEIIRISGDIFVSRESQKTILIGSGGKKIRRIGTDARIEMELFFGKKVFLELFVKVDKDWRMKEDKLKKYGYIN